jgi:hypothetical protein
MEERKAKGLDDDAVSEPQAETPDSKSAPGYQT